MPDSEPKLKKEDVDPMTKAGDKIPEGVVLGDDAQGAQPLTSAPTADPILHCLPAETQQELDRLEKKFELDATFLRRIVDQFVSDFRLGLKQYGEPMAMIPTYVTGVPNGAETG